MSTGGMSGAGTTAAMVPLMAAMMLPSALPVLLRLGTLRAVRFSAVYGLAWALGGLLVWQLDPAPSTVVALGAALLYELSPLKARCRRLCRSETRSPWRFSLYCYGSSLGLMLITLVSMSALVVIGVALIALLQKLLPPRHARDLPLVLGVAVLAVL